jgi:hypothetical protein
VLGPGRRRGRIADGFRAEGSKHEVRGVESRGVASEGMKRHHHTPEPVVRKLCEGERLLSEGKDLTEVLRTLEISEAT